MFSKYDNWNKLPFIKKSLETQNIAMFPKLSNIPPGFQNMILETNRDYLFRKIFIDSKYFKILQYSNLANILQCIQNITIGNMNLIPFSFS